MAISLGIYPIFRQTHIIPIIWCSGVFGNSYPFDGHFGGANPSFRHAQRLTPPKNTVASDQRDEKSGARVVWNGCCVKHKQTTNFQFSIVEATTSDKKNWPWNRKPNLNRNNAQFDFLSKSVCANHPAKCRAKKTLEQSRQDVRSGMGCSCGLSTND